MSFTLQIAGAPPGPGACFPPTYQAFVADIASRLSAIGLEALSTINYGPSTPPTNMQSSPWFKTDAQFNPINWYSFDGTWKPIPPPLIPGHLAPFWGLSANVVAPWYLCTGQVVNGPINGSLTTPNMQGLTVIGTGTNPATGTNFTNQTQVGEEKHLQTAAEVGPHVHPPLNASATEVLSASGGGSELGGGGGLTVYNDATTGMNTGGTAFNVMQPSMAMYWTIFWP